MANAEIVDCNGEAVSSGNVSDSDSSGDADDSGGSVVWPAGWLRRFYRPGGIYGEERVREWLKGAEIFDEPEGAASVARIGDVAVATAKDGLHYFLYDREREMGAAWGDARALRWSSL